MEQKTSRYIGICYYCREDVLEDKFVTYDDKPFHKKCVKKYKGVE